MFPVVLNSQEPSSQHSQTSDICLLSYDLLTRMLSIIKGLFIIQYLKQYETTEGIYVMIFLNRSVMQVNVNYFNELLYTKMSVQSFQPPEFSLMLI